MKFVELNRYFFPIKTDEEFDESVDQMWDKQIGGWLEPLNWKVLLKKHRVILLAEALSGKTQEFRNIAAKLSAEGNAAFFVPIEALADDGFEASLEPNAIEAFNNWKKSFEDAL